MRNKVLVVGQTPPPFGGQAMMIERLVKATFQNLEIIHVRMGFSDNFKEVGKSNLKKLLHLPTLIIKVIYTRFKFRVTTLYYPPAGPNYNPLLRDLVILFFIRPFFKKVIFHFRAAGVSELLEGASPFIRLLGKTVYRNPDAGIQLSLLNPPDAKYFNAKKIYVIKNGLEDAAEPFLPILRKSSSRINILYAGVLIETKGILTILETVKILKSKGLDFNFVCIGDFGSPEFEKKVSDLVKLYQIREHISFPGVKTGPDKWNEFMKADIFCFPSFFESESFGNVVVEAMMFELPVIATQWRGIPDIVDDRETGVLIPIQDAEALAENILRLSSDSILRKQMGTKGRIKFLQEYRLPMHLQSMEKMFSEVLSPGNE